ERYEQTLAAELEFRDRPGRRDAEKRVERHGDRGRQQREPDGGERVGVGERRQHGTEAFRERLGENDDERQQQEGDEEQERGADQDAAHGGWLADARSIDVSHGGGSTPAAD